MYNTSITITYIHKNIVKHLLQFTYFALHGVKSGNSYMYSHVLVEFGIQKGNVIWKLLRYKS